MSEEFELTPELAKFENELRSRALPTPSLDRDELMFRAGWNAAVAQSKTSSYRLPNRSSVVRWRAAAASLAGLSAVLALLLLQQSVSETLNLQPTIANKTSTEFSRSTPNDAPAVELTAASINKTESPSARGKKNPRANPLEFGRHRGGLTPLYSNSPSSAFAIGWPRELESDWPRQVPVLYSKTKKSNRQQTGLTARELLQELLPDSTTEQVKSQPPVWGWLFKEWGAVL